MQLLSTLNFLWTSNVSLIVNWTTHLKGFVNFFQYEINIIIIIIPDPLSPLLPIVHRLWRVFRATSRILTELLYVVAYIYILDKYWHNDKRRIKDAGRKMQEDFFRKIFTSHFIARVWKGCSRFACERVMETEHKLHILTPLLWPSRCVFLVLLMLGSTPSGLSEGPLGWVWLSLPHLVSNSLEVCWQLLWHPKLNWVK